jgi:hypothetical protein
MLKTNAFLAFSIAALASCGASKTNQSMDIGQGEIQGGHWVVQADFPEQKGHVTSHLCIMAREAVAPTLATVLEQNAHENCFGKIPLKGGKIEIEGRCRVAGADNFRMPQSIKGTYTRTSLSVQLTYNFTGEPVVQHLTASHVDGCKDLQGRYYE